METGGVKALSWTHPGQVDHVFHAVLLLALGGQRLEQAVKQLVLPAMCRNAKTPLAQQILSYGLGWGGRTHLTSRRDDM